MLDAERNIGRMIAKLIDMHSLMKSEHQLYLKLLLKVSFWLRELFK
jgi:hypothetical protein